MGWPAPPSGRPLEAEGNLCPREMTARRELNFSPPTEFGLQAYSAPLPPLPTPVGKKALKPLYNHELNFCQQ